MRKKEKQSFVLGINKKEEFLNLPKTKKHTRQNLFELLRKNDATYTAATRGQRPWGVMRTMKRKRSIMREQTRLFFSDWDFFASSVGGCGDTFLRLFLSPWRNWGQDVVKKAKSASSLGPH